MSKWFEVTVTKTKVFAVEIRDDESEDDAIRYACDEAGEFDEVKCSDQVLDPAHIDSIKRHADEVLSIDGDDATITKDQS